MHAWIWMKLLRKEWRLCERTDISLLCILLLRPLRWRLRSLLLRWRRLLRRCTCRQGVGGLRSGLRRWRQLCTTELALLLLRGNNVLVVLRGLLVQLLRWVLSTLITCFKDIKLDDK